ncbi:MAG TPA: hypothetical protein VJM53_09425 [Burkholderiales bacterium]|jgi:hypothetical protein|nr:hypothetical protein [Burkholderiales bacterium]
MAKTKRNSHSSYDPAAIETGLGPLGLLPSFEISADTKDKLKKLERFSLEREIRVLSKDENFTLDDRGIPTLAREFKRFMSLGLLFPKPKYNFAPSKPVDRMWHELILDTRRYDAMCMEVHGAFVHHNPLDPEQIAENAGEVIRYTKECIGTAYGATVPWIWGGKMAICYYTSGCDQLACW